MRVPQQTSIIHVKGCVSQMLMNFHEVQLQVLAIQSRYYSSLMLHQPYTITIRKSHSLHSQSNTHMTDSQLINYRSRPGSYMLLQRYVYPSHQGHWVSKRSYCFGPYSIGLLVEDQFREHEETEG